MAGMVIVFAIVVAVLVSFLGNTDAFHVTNRIIRQSSRIHNAPESAKVDKDKSKLTFGKLIQLIGMGAGKRQR